MSHTALLRAVNVGERNRVGMTELRALVAKLRLDLCLAALVRDDRAVVEHGEGGA